MRGKDLEVGMVMGTKRVTQILSRGVEVLYLYDYVVSDEYGKLRWYRQIPAPVASIRANAKIPAPATESEANHERP